MTGESPVTSSNCDYLQRAMTLLERDLQLASRRTLSDDASASQAMIGQPGELRLVRGGWRNPLDQPRSRCCRCATCG
ncbi:hypothetical protein [Pseudomonas sp. TH10]|uniref:hypothetical protein n=1 Tax=Pseudomonas sp. TH10 TaxID=2796376 RepID=UPI001F5BCF06|nr:hypothetical protein [Pseudomonas sp. TH10]